MGKAHRTFQEPFQAIFDATNEKTEPGKYEILVVKCDLYIFLLDSPHEVCRYVMFSVHCTMLELNIFSILLSTSKTGCII